jgi:hypothetical protein
VDDALIEEIEATAHSIGLTVTFEDDGVWSVGPAAPHFPFMSFYVDGNAYEGIVAHVSPLVVGDKEMPLGRLWYVHHVEHGGDAFGTATPGSLQPIFGAILNLALVLLAKG